MKILSLVAVLTAIGASIATAVLWQRNQSLQLQIAELRAQNQTSQEQSQLAAKSADAETTRIREETAVQTRELMKLRGDVNRMRSSGSEELQKLRAENADLKRTLQDQAGHNSTPSTQPAGNASFPRESWSFAGYKSPESAMISAIWAMREGDPKTYFNSLTPDEQARVGKQWENKAESDIIAKHQNDVSKITGMQIMDRQPVSDDEMTMTVHIEGVDRTENVRMQKVNGEWKFGGYIPPPPK